MARVPLQREVILPRQLAVPTELEILMNLEPVVSVDLERATETEVTELYTEPVVVEVILIHPQLEVEVTEHQDL